LKLTANRLCLLAAIWIVATANGAFWRMLFQQQGEAAPTPLFIASLCVALVGLNLLLLRLLTPGRLLKPMLTLLLLIAAGTGWFMDTYGVALDSEMLRNVLQTNLAEAADFIGWPLLWRVLWSAVLPAVLIWRAQLPERSIFLATRDYLLGAAAGVALVLAAGLPLYSSYVSYFRTQFAARYLLAPANVVVGSVRLARKSLHANRPHVVVGIDAHRAAAPNAKPLLVLVVVGETARAANFSLGGYARQTNPQLPQRNVMYFTSVHSCGTATAVSVPCMFSDLPREEFDLSHADRRDSVLDILQRAGLSVTWIDNQSGCKKVCDRVPHEKAEGFHPQSCHHGECLDETLLRALDAKLPDISKDSVLLLHAMGSHGPSYHRRVPSEWRRFTPTCDTDRIEHCSDEQIVNTYDNTILYTDYILAGLIDRLQLQAARIDSVLLYVSDHGESLGENGLYLHGQPWLIAPEVQKHVPMLMWLSEGTSERLGVDVQCLRNKRDQPLSHDHLSHTLLGLASVQTALHRPALDMLHGCQHH
jgi:lipid A ethanolaminephosphotransferase